MSTNLILMQVNIVLLFIFRSHEKTRKKKSGYGAAFLKVLQLRCTQSVDLIPVVQRTWYTKNSVCQLYLNRYKVDCGQ